MTEPFIHVEQGDALTFLRELDANSINCICTDPPYESMNVHKSHGTTTRLKKWFPTVSNMYLHDCLVEFGRVLAPGSACFIMCDNTTAAWYEQFNRDRRKDGAKNTTVRGLTYWKRLVWHKTGRRGMGYHFPASHEYVLLYEKGKRKYEGATSDVIVADKIMTRDAYPTQKPHGLIAPLLETALDSTNDIVLDPFCGSGSVGEVTKEMGCNFIGVDIQEEAVCLTKKNLNLS